MKIALLISFLIFSVFGYAQSVEEIVSQAKNEYEAGNYSKSIELLDKAIKKDKKNVDAYFGRASSKSRIKDLKGAEKDYKTLLKLSPNHFPSLINLGILYGTQDKNELALKQFNKAEKIDSKNTKVYINRGYVYGSMSNWEKALNDYSRYIEMDSTSAKAYMFRSECLMFLGKNELCIKDLLKVIELDSTITIAKVNLGFTYLSMKNIPMADSVYSELYKTESGNPYVLSNYGYINHLKGKTEEGIKMINESLTLYSDNSYAYKYLALIYIDLKKPEEACKAIDKSLAFGFTKMFGSEMEDLKKNNCK